MKWSDNVNFKDYYKVDEKGKHDLIITLYNPTNHKELVIRVDGDENTPLNKYLKNETINFEARHQWYVETKNTIEVGDVVKVVNGCKLTGEIKKVESKINFIPNGTFKEVPYLLFTDGTRCAEKNCRLYGDAIPLP